MHTIRKTDQDYLDEAAAAFERDEIIDDLHARVVAAAWHSGNGLTTLATNGAIDLRVIRDVRREMEENGVQHPELLALAAYVVHHGHRGPQEGWEALHW